LDYVVRCEVEANSPLWEEVRKEFAYWYPGDISLGGKEHQKVHFPVYIMNHVVILPPDKWPKGIFVNYWLIGKGGNISKSKGGASASPQEAARKFSVDALRLYYAHVGSPHSDIEWNEDAVFSYKSHVEGIYAIASRFGKLDGKVSPLDLWLESRFNSKLKAYLEAMDKYELRKAIGIMLFDFEKDLAWYEKRGGKGKAAREIIGGWLRCLSPFVPYVAEECWEMLGNSTLVAGETLPEPDESKISPAAEAGEEIIQATEQDIGNVIKLAGIKPETITLFIAPEWKRVAWKKAKSLSRDSIMPELMKMPEMKSKEGARFAGYLQKKFRSLWDITSMKVEEKAISSALGYLSDKFGVKVVVADPSSNPKGENALPGKPAILVE